ncbi:MAG: glutamate synthase small subunit [Chitinivibrionales bacterium]|nr:glutamate synthase small subunit [Chitinivibrionales bacterium]
MGKQTGFIEFERKAPGYKPVEERLKEYTEFVVLQPEEELQRQGARCMDCGIPFCHTSGCPVYNLIPEWNDLVYRGKWKEAYERLELTNNLPEITGRICPAPCETSCTLAINSAPITIKQLELAIIERAFREGWVVPRPPRFESGKKVAVIGSGPAGLAAAQEARRAGHQVTLFESADKIGGILRYGIPDFKLEKWIIDRRLDQMKAEGVEFAANVKIGEDLSARYLKRMFDAIILTMGAGEPRDLKVPGRELDGIHFAMDFLTLNNKYVAGDLEFNQIISAKDRNVLVIGGGDTGSDCVGTSNRHGAGKVHQFEIMPRPQDWGETWNPQWPQWPSILRTSSSHEEGCERDWNILTTHFSGDKRVETAHFKRIEWQKSEGSPRPKMVEVPGSEFELNVDRVFLAMGFVHVEHSKLLEDLGVEFDQRGNIMTDGKYATSVPGVYTAGDANIGASLVVRAIYHGREAAHQADMHLKAAATT